MKIAIPTNNGRLSAHFGHCEKFAIVETDSASKKITGIEYFAPPAHEPGVLPSWLSESGVEIIIAGGMGNRAQQLFDQYKIGVQVGAADATPEEIVTDYLAGKLQTGDNVCDH